MQGRSQTKRCPPFWIVPRPDHMLDGMSKVWRNILCKGRSLREGGEERKEGEVAYSASSVVLDKKNIISAPRQQKHFLKSCSLPFFFFPFHWSSFLKGIGKRGCWSRECIYLSPGFMLTLLPEHSGTSHQGCSFCAQGELHLSKAPSLRAGGEHRGWSRSIHVQKASCECQI